MRQVKGEWYLIKKDVDAGTISSAKDFTQRKYAYFMDREAFSKIDDEVAYYESALLFEHCDIIFEPTFMIHDRLQSLFQFLEPELQFKGVQLYESRNQKETPAPLYWVPYLEYAPAIDKSSRIVQGRAQKLILNGEYLSENNYRRVLHCKLPAQDIWLLSLEGAECLLRREPSGVWLERVDIRD